MSTGNLNDLKRTNLLLVHLRCPRVACCVHQGKHLRNGDDLPSHLDKTGCKENFISVLQR